MVRIRLTRMGQRKRPFYRIVVADNRFPRDGKFLEVLGTYDPRQKEKGVVIHSEKVEAWLKKGAQPSDTVKVLLKKSGMFRS